MSAFGPDCVRTQIADVIRQMAIHAYKEAIFIEDGVSSDSLDVSIDWVNITSNQAFINDDDVGSFQDDWYNVLKPINWTDDFSNLFEIVKW